MIEEDPQLTQQRQFGGDRPPLQLLPVPGDGDVVGHRVVELGAAARAGEDHVAAVQGRGGGNVQRHVHPAGGPQQGQQPTSGQVQRMIGRPDRLRDLAQHVQGDGEIVGGQDPDRADVALGHLAADAVQRQPARRAEFAAPDDLRQSLDPWMVAPLVHDEDPAAGRPRQRPGPVQIHVQRLLDEDRTIAWQQLLDLLQMGPLRRGDDIAVQHRQLLQGGDHLGGAHRPRVGGAFGRSRHRPDLRPEGDEVADDEPAPASGPDDADLRLLSHGRPAA